MDWKLKGERTTNDANKWVHVRNAAVRCVCGFSTLHKNDYHSNKSHDRLAEYDGLRLTDLSQQGLLKMSTHQSLLCAIVVVALFLASLLDFAPNLPVKSPSHDVPPSLVRGSTTPATVSFHPLATARNVAAFLWPGKSSHTRSWRSVSWTGVPRGGYPLTQADLERSLRRPAGTLAACAWARVRASLDRGKPLRIIVFGGSMTLGTDCPGGVAGCAWPHTIVPWLNGVAPAWRVSLHNAAKRGTSATIFAGMFSLPPADVYILDFTLNRGPLQLHLLVDRLLRSKPPGTTNATFPAILILSTIRLFRDVSDAQNYCRPHEVGSAHGAWWCRPYTTEMGDIHDETAAQFGLAHVDYRRAVWPHLESPPLDLKWFWQTQAGVPSSHPSRVTHELVGDVVKHALAVSLRLGGEPDTESCGMVDPSVRVVPAVPAPYLCAARAGDGAPVSRLDASTRSFTRATHGRGWTWKKLDVKRALGWVWQPRSKQRGALKLRVTTSLSPRLELTFLRSGTTPLGAAELVLSGPGCLGGARVRLDGVGNATSTVPVLVSLDAAQAGVDDVLLQQPWPCGGDGGGVVNLELTVDSQRPWVLFQVAAC